MPSAINIDEHICHVHVALSGDFKRTLVGALRVVMARGERVSRAGRLALQEQTASFMTQRGCRRCWRRQCEGNWARATGFRRGTVIRIAVRWWAACHHGIDEWFQSDYNFRPLNTSKYLGATRLLTASLSLMPAR